MNMNGLTFPCWCNADLKGRERVIAGYKHLDKKQRAALAGQVANHDLNSRASCNTRLLDRLETRFGVAAEGIFDECDRPTYDSRRSVIVQVHQ